MTRRKVARKLPEKIYGFKDYSKLELLLMSTKQLNTRRKGLENASKRLSRTSTKGAMHSYVNPRAVRLERMRNRVVDVLRERRMSPKLRGKK